MENQSGTPGGVTDTVRGRVASRDGTPIAYERRGEGPPVVLVGGALSTARSEAPLAGLLAGGARRAGDGEHGEYGAYGGHGERTGHPGFRVYTYDRRGRGASGDAPGYAVAREVEDLAAVLGAAGPGAHLHGDSSGGALALEAAAAGLPIGRLSVYEPPYGTDPADRAPFARVAGRLTGLLAEGRREEALAFFLGASMPAAELDRLRSSPAWRGLTALAPTLRYDHEVLGEGLVPGGRLGAVTARAMVVDGGSSPAWLRTAARAVSRALPRGRHRTLTGQTRTPAPQVLAPVLAEFYRA
ncbi:alpha/beta hydrolase [Streptomyces sp. LP05-1]|uniref:Alpha/beta hydrolase n=1 Tax=Streptomyces pyxinae TaxID=2970734 RepID=A0ABT2CBD7_9ACTN|nr:alpha/beta fold hydrolase [Streptomyces sp. LP05-1]MCS0634081.1 alpha/beta hydrolase [Streptomyces sp. LP05-1]